jgi:hypothetical protein
MAVGPRPNLETVEVLLDTVWRVTASEAAVTQDLDRKASTLATFASVVLSLTASLGAGFLESFAERWAFALYVAGLIALLGSVALAVRVLWPKGHVTLGMARIERFPMWSEIRKPPEQVRAETMDALVEALAEERDINRGKGRDVRAAFALLLTGLVFVVLEASILGAREFA